MTDNFPSLCGTERARAEDWIGVSTVFTWATLRLRAVDAECRGRPSDRLQKARENSAAAITEVLLDWEPTHRPN